MEIVTNYDKLSERCDEIDVRKENAETIVNMSDRQTVFNSIINK